MKLLDHCSLRAQLIGIVLVTCAAILFVNAGLFAFYDLAQFRQAKENELSVLAQVIGEHSVAALVFQDAEAATASLEGLRTIPYVQLAVLYTLSGQPFAWYLPGELRSGLPARVPEPGYREGVLHYVAPVYWDGQPQGYVYLAASLADWRDRVRNYATIGSIVLLFSLGIGFLLLSLLQQRVSRPLAQLADASQQVATSYDYTIRVPVEGPQELQKLAAAFNEMLKRVQEHQAVLVAAKEAAEEMSRLKSTFLANLNHEIRTPLAGILGYAQILQEVLENPEQREMAQIIEQSGRRLLDTLDALLYLACLEAGTVRVQHQPLDVVAATQQVVAELLPVAQAKGLTCTVHSTAPQLEFCVDAGLWERLVKSLVHNAIKFTQAGYVRVLLDSDETTAQLQVVDTGIGIPEEAQSMIFEAFKQVSEGLTRDYEGSGLGLAIVQRIVRLLGGQIYVESQPGVGSIFTVILPRCREVEEGRPLSAFAVAGRT